MYTAVNDRYEKMKYCRCGNSGVKLPVLSLGLWQNFGPDRPIAEQEEIIFHAFDQGITHFDLANTYGSPIRGRTEENFGQFIRDGLGVYRDEILISTKAGFPMWDGPYGDGGGRKYLMNSLDQSLKRMNLEYVDIFYHHRPDPETPLEETMGTLADMVRQGKALYIGLSNYSDEQASKAIRVLKDFGVHCLIHQTRFNMFDRTAEDGLLDTLSREGVGCIAYSPLAQGALTDKYLNGIPEMSRAAKAGTTVTSRYLSETQLAQIRLLNQIAAERGQPLAQMALAWILNHKEVTSVLVGASRISQLDANLKVLDSPPFSAEEEAQIHACLRGELQGE